ncbi:MAG: hypothetical protein A2138_15980 [Deltaproteobacteria bacterium RBG_16_71_12]|nr:MAG: hypothetical protein A2138_15980 [Deltaproteobacteria bacterium RBG_16_71_12]
MTEGKLPVRVLVIEDDDTLAMLLTRVLQRDGCLITHSRDGEAGLEAFTREQPHVVLSDGLLPKLTGFEVCKAIREKAGDTVGIIMMSAGFKAVSLRSKEAQEARADAFLSKPFVLGDLRKRVLDLARRIIDVRAAAAGEAPMVHKERTRTGPVMLPLESGQIASPHAVAHSMLGLARGGATGLLRLEWEGSRLELALLRGVLVGARDNLREHQLGERLLRQGRITHEQLKHVNERVAAGERVAEALITMGLCDACDALALIEEQVRERLARALGWGHGTLRFVADEPAVHSLAVETYDLQQEILAFALDALRAADADRFLEARAPERATRTLDFETGLAHYARMRPSSTLAPLLSAGAPTVGEAAAASPHDRRDLYALWMAGVVCLQHDPPGVERPLASPARSEETAGFLVDKAAADKIAAALLRCRGRNHYEALGVARDAPMTEVAARLSDLEREVGVETLGSAKLGSARAAARELWALFDAMRAELLDPEAREVYDVGLDPPAPKRPAPQMAPEQAFLDGQLQLGLGNLQGAKEAFERAAAARPNDPDFNAWLAWAAILCGEDELFALDVLETAARAFPQAMRPVFFLGLAAKRRGDLVLAHAHLAEAVRRSPHDREARAVLAALAPGA